MTAGQHRHAHSDRQAVNVRIPIIEPRRSVIRLDVQAKNAFHQRLGDSASAGILIGKRIAALPQHRAEFVILDAVLQIGRAHV